MARGNRRWPAGRSFPHRLIYHRLEKSATSISGGFRGDEVIPPASRASFPSLAQEPLPLTHGGTGVHNGCTANSPTDPIALGVVRSAPPARGPHAGPDRQRRSRDHGSRPLQSGQRRDQGAGVSRTTGLLKTPTPSNSTSTMSPGRIASVVPDVPVKIRSPG